MPDDQEFTIREGLKVTMRTFNMAEELQADRYISMAGVTLDRIARTKIYSICAIRKVNDTEVTPLKNDLEFGKVAAKFTTGEGLLLAFHYNNVVESGETEEVKNLLTALLPDSSQPPSSSQEAV